MSVRPTARIALLVIVVLCLGLLSVGVAGAQATTNKVSITTTEFAFNPTTFTVAQGTAVTFTVTNPGAAPHNVEFELVGKNQEHKLFETNLAPGETRTATYTFPTAGDWRMYCPVGTHADRGMVGTIKVLASAAPQALPVTGGAIPALPALLAAGGLAVLAGLAGLRMRRGARS